MRLSYRELQKREVINVEDGRCLGRIIDVDFQFPEGVLTGIVVPGRRVRWFRLFDKTDIYIDHKRIIKIGGDVILVNINCGETCAPNVRANAPHKKGKDCSPNYPPCPPPPCPPPPCPPRRKEDGHPTCEQLFGEEVGYEDY